MAPRCAGWLPTTTCWSTAAVKFKTNQSWIADYLAPGYKIEPYEILEPVEKVWGDGAVMGGLVHLKGLSGGKPFAISLRFADIWAKRNGKWQVVYTHVSEPPQ